MIQISNRNCSYHIANVFMKFYILFGKVVRPFYIDFIGPFLPLFSGFQIIRSESDRECGRMNTESISLINNVALGIFSCG